VFVVVNVLVVVLNAALDPRLVREGAG
jgi:hypothetical protein